MCWGWFPWLVAVPNVPIYTLLSGTCVLKPGTSYTSVSSWEMLHLLDIKNVTMFLNLSLLGSNKIRYLAVFVSYNTSFHYIVAQGTKMTVFIWLEVFSVPMLQGLPLLLQLTLDHQPKCVEGNKTNDNQTSSYLCLLEWLSTCTLTSVRAWIVQPNINCQGKN